MTERLFLHHFLLRIKLPKGQKGNLTLEIKQLEYFVATADHGSLNKAAEYLYTSQPNVSKVIANLEKELGVLLFERNSRGIKITEQGNLLYSYALTILKNANIIRDMVKKQTDSCFCVSGYQSNILTRLVADLYEAHKDKGIKFGYREGTVEEITDHVSDHISEIGIVYLAHSQLPCFQHIMWHKKLEYHPLGDRGICIYMGERHPWYHRDLIEFNELKELKFMEGTEDFFAMEHHIDRISIGALQMENCNNAVYTNSDYMIHNMLRYTDVCCMGIDFVSKEYENQGIKALKVKDCERFLTLGFVKQKKKELSMEAKFYIKELKKKLTEYNESL
jgi:DNA-binding transcriptional LysR family regulator